ncbi:alpha/beta-hydrolase [Xylona heveae TC161]|uniref:Alpha/beta-hydrolase n=1 Tax=Xylona heveae (strain CBS 132557 / TC161) TaxID=1328760 RepID=A0A165I4B7_XYLHT|nr:alpha/beta-hydrolase [Xylona heveae TC161]KZF24362.1 alpha/beta-hydrolase [Xylona heveae TC161]
MVSWNLLSIALAIGVVSVQAAPLETRSISQDLFNKFNLFEQYAAAAYCANNNNSPGNKVTCPPGNCPLVEASNTVTSLEFQNSLLTDVTGFVAIDSTHSLIVVSFRGSNSIRNFLADADFPLVTTDICAGCSADQGFWTSWVEARSGVLAAVEAAASAHPSYQVVVTGHSLGGAIADFAAAELRKAGYNAALYTFGSPRIAPAPLSDYITNNPGAGNYRVTHYDDPVPRLPPLLLGFVHISPEYWITTGNEVPVTPGVIEVLTGDVNLSGNTGEPPGLDLDAHSWYFGNISACGNFEIYRE